jgi:hypothetical protein
MKKFLLITLPMMAACSSSPKLVETATPETRPDIVLSRIDDLKERPSWVHESQPFRQDGEKILSQATTQIPSDHRLEAAYRICFNSAKANIATAIEQKMQFIFQQSSEGTDDRTTAHFIGSEMATMTSSSLRPANQYYEKVATTTDSGERKTIYRIFCEVQMPAEDFKTKVFAAMTAAEGQGKISSGFQAKIESQWNSFVNGPQAGPASVQPSPVPQGR